MPAVMPLGCAATMSLGCAAMPVGYATIVPLGYDAMPLGCAATVRLGCGGDGLSNRLAVGYDVSPNGDWQVFHTQFKSFVRMHPSSVFAASTEVFDASSEILVFEKLLETHKPFLTNCTRAPALPVI